MKANRPRDIATCVGHYLKNGDLEGILTMFHPDCVLVFPEGAQAVTGLDEVRKAFEPFVEFRPDLHSEVTGELIHGDTALLSANWVIKGPDGSTIASGKSTEIAKRKADGSWVYFMDCPYGPHLNQEL